MPCQWVSNNYLRFILPGRTRPRKRPKPQSGGLAIAFESRRRRYPGQTYHRNNNFASVLLSIHIIAACARALCVWTSALCQLRFAICGIGAVCRLEYPNSDYHAQLSTGLISLPPEHSGIPRRVRLQKNCRFDLAPPGAFWYRNRLFGHVHDLVLISLPLEHSGIRLVVMVTGTAPF